MQRGNRAYLVSSSLRSGSGQGFLQGDENVCSWLGRNAVEDGLPMATGADQAVEAQPRQLLRHGSLPSTEASLEFRHAFFAPDEVAHDQEAGFVGERLQERGCTTRACDELIHFGWGCHGMGSNPNDVPAAPVNLLRVLT